MLDIDTVNETRRSQEVEEVVAAARSLQLDARERYGPFWIIGLEAEMRSAVGLPDVAETAFTPPPRGGRGRPELNIPSYNLPPLSRMVRDLRHMQRMIRPDLVERTGLGTMYIAQVELGYMPFSSPERLFTIAQGLGVDPIYLIALTPLGVE